MATLRQKKLAKAVVNNAKATKPLNKQELVVSVGYSEMSGEKKATEILESKGTLEELNNLGFTEEGAKGVVQEILYDVLVDKNIRLNAAKEVFKIFGTYAAEKSFNMTVNTSVEELNSVIKDELAKFRTHK